MTQEDDEDSEEDDAGPRAPYVGRWCDLMSDEEGDEGHEGDAGEPRQPADRGEEGHGGAPDASRSTAEDPPGFLRLLGGPSCHAADAWRILGRETWCAAAADDTSGAAHYADADGRAAAAADYASDAYADYAAYRRATFAADCAAAWDSADECDAVVVCDLAAAGGSCSAAATGDPTAPRRRPHLTDYASNAYADFDAYRRLPYARRLLRLQRLRRLRRLRLRRLLRGRLRPRRCADYVATGDSTTDSDEPFARADRLRRALEQRKRAAHRWTPSVPP